MPRFPLVAILVWSCAASGQDTATTADAKLNDALREIAGLRRTVSQQDSRIANLERTVRSMQATLVASARRLQLAASKTPEGWAGIKVGMSRAQVVDILGEPTTVDSVIDRQTLTYKDGSDLMGTVILVDDRVSEVVARRFQTNLPGRPQN